MWFALGLLAVWLIIAKVLDYAISKKVEKMKMQNAIEINQECDAIDVKAESVAQEILQAMKNAENLPEEQRACFMDKYGELLFEVDKAKSDAKHIRSEFPLEGELINV